MLAICSQQVFNSFTSCFQLNYIIIRFLKEWSSHEELLGVLMVSCTKLHLPTHRYTKLPPQSRVRTCNWALNTFPVFSRQWYHVHQAMLPCSEGYADLFSRLCILFSRLCYPVHQAKLPLQQTMLPCSAGYATCSAGYATCSAVYATLFSRLCYPVQQAMLPCSAGYASLFSRLC